MAVAIALPTTPISSHGRRNLAWRHGDASSAFFAASDLLRIPAM
jgi:hypothetical protein